MKYILDSHAIIWMIENNVKMPSRIKDIIISPENTIYISSVSLWEIAIKMDLGKLTLNVSFDDLLEYIDIRDFDILQIKGDYLKGLSGLPYIHNDPFDRLIISTAVSENLTIITIDDNIQKYNVSWIW